VARALVILKRRIFFGIGDLRAVHRVTGCNNVTGRFQGLIVVLQQLLLNQRQLNGPVDVFLQLSLFFRQTIVVPKILPLRVSTLQRNHTAAVREVRHEIGVTWRVAAVTARGKLAGAIWQGRERMGRRQGAVGDAGHAAVEAVEIRVERAVTAVHRRVEVAVHIHRWVPQHTSMCVGVGRGGKPVDFMEMDLSIMVGLFCTQGKDGKKRVSKRKEQNRKEEEEEKETSCTTDAPPGLLLLSCWLRWW